MYVHTTALWNCSDPKKLQGGNKDELASRIAESKVLGVIPQCKACGGGRPKWMNGYWTCLGYLDDTDWSECFFVDREIERVDWKEEN